MKRLWQKLLDKICKWLGVPNPDDFKPENMNWGITMTEQEELAIEVLQEQMERARFETIELGNAEVKE